MSSFFAALHELGVSPWVTARLWLAVIFAFSAWGVLRLLDVLVGRPRGIAHLVAAAFYVLNPYTVVFSGRTTSALVGYAALPGCCSSSSMACGRCGAGVGVGAAGGGRRPSR